MKIRRMYLYETTPANGRQVAWVGTRPRFGPSAHEMARRAELGARVVSAMDAENGIYGYAAIYGRATPTVGIEVCGCEAAIHFGKFLPVEGCAHPFRCAPAGKHVAFYVGPVCDDCADTHMKPYLR